jgi:hypothetical protein
MVLLWREDLRSEYGIGSGRISHEIAAFFASVSAASLSEMLQWEGIQMKVIFFPVLFNLQSLVFIS